MLRARLQTIEIDRKTDKGVIQYVFEAFAYSDRDYNLRSIKRYTPKSPEIASCEDEDYVCEEVSEDDVPYNVVEEFCACLFKDEY